MINFFKNLFKKEEPDPMKYLIAGLGNAGAKYDNTRHNIGFDVVDLLAKEFDVEFKDDNLAYVAEFKHKGRTFVLIKPTTYMNLSGKAIRYWLQKKKILKENLLVIVDDLNLPFGAQRIRAKGSAGGHNGLKDTEQMTGGSNYARLRIGIGRDFGRGQQSDYVLGKWTSEEGEELKEVLRFAADAVKSFGAIGIKHTMSKYNRQPKKEKKEKE